MSATPYLTGIHFTSCLSHFSASCLEDRKTQQLSALRLVRHLAISYNQNFNVLREGTIVHIPAHVYVYAHVYMFILQTLVHVQYAQQICLFCLLVLFLNKTLLI